MLIKQLVFTASAAFCAAILFFSSCKKENAQAAGEFFLQEVNVGSKSLSLYTPLLNDNAPYDQVITLLFNEPVEAQSIANGITLNTTTGGHKFKYTLSDMGRNLVLTPDASLTPMTAYTLNITAALTTTSKVACKPISVQFVTKTGDFNVVSAFANGKALGLQALRDVAQDVAIKIKFSQPVDSTTLTADNIKLFRAGAFEALRWTYSRTDSSLTIRPEKPLRHFEKYTLSLDNGIKGPVGYQLTLFNRIFYTAIDPTPKFPVLSDDALLDLVQRQTFKYFWDFGHPVSGLARERNTSGDIVTSGGSGFGLMSIIVGIERGFISRSEGLARWQKIIGFLSNKAQRYHGAFPHWLNGASGATVPFSTKDNGADLVETSYLMQGLLTVRQYLNPAETSENQMIKDINALWEAVEWDWFTRGGQKVLYWHWSPNYNWDMNHQIRGYNECLITYFLAAASPTHPIDATVYHQGWASNGGIRNNNAYYGHVLPLGSPLGGPLFFAHYSFLGLDPRNLKDQYAVYWTQNRNHTLINRAYCIANPLQKVAYSAQCWGLTASDNQNGYNAHSPTNDLGVITPTAALSSFPYTPAESMQALRFFYEQLGDKLWGDYGFYDAFNPTEAWFANSTLAIDQGPIILMVENHRSAKLWNLFMSCPETAVGAKRLGFE